MIVQNVIKLRNDKEEISIPDSITITIKSTSSSSSSVTSSFKRKIDVNVSYYNSNTCQPFKNCKKLKRLKFGSKISSISGGALVGCTSLESIIVDGANENYTSEDGVLYSKDKSILIRMPPSIYRDNCKIINSVQTIGGYAFESCPLEEICFTSNVRKVGANAFLNCESLKKVKTVGLSYWMDIDFENAESNPLFHAHRLYNALTLDTTIQDEEITNITIPQHTSSIKSYTFCGAYFESVTIPNSVTGIWNTAFQDSKIERLDIHSTTIESWFGGVASIGEVFLGDDVKKIAARAFWGCNTSVWFSDNVESIGNDAFNSNVNLFVKKGTKSLLSIWKYTPTPPYDANYQSKAVPPTPLPRPELSLKSSTQTTIDVSLINRIDGYSYSYSGYNTEEAITGTSFSISGLRPSQQESYCLNISLDDFKYTSDWFYFYTKGLDNTVELISKTTSSITAKGSYTHGDAEVSEPKMSINGTTVDGDEIRVNGLEPNNNYTVYYMVTVKYGNNYQHSDTYIETKNVTTPALTLATQQPKVISEGNVIVAAQSNLDDDEENVGFEWRRTDWTDDFSSNAGKAYLYEGMLEGYIRNMNTDKLWKYRPYYESASGKRYYGDWIGIDPTNTSYFDPTVHTYASIKVNGNTALVRGYVQRGSDNVVEQGFKYWQETSGSRNTTASRVASIPMVPNNAMVVTASGTLMEAELKKLTYDAIYHCVAFVTTSEGETFYGDERQFTTGANPVGIDEVGITSPQVEPVAYYNLNGHRQSIPNGIVIVRMSDGTTKKVIFK